MDSIWVKTAQMPRFDPLQADIKTDVLVVGGGIAGLLCAYSLSRAGVDCVLIEANRLCSGVTKNTTAKITSQHGLIYHKLVREFGVESARLYLAANQAALEQYRSLCQGLDCDFEEKDAFVYSRRGREKLEKELAALRKLGFDAQFVTKLPLPFPIAGAIRFQHQAQFHPLKFLAAIAKDLRVFERTKLVKITPEGAITTGGTITAGRTVIATHFPMLNTHGSYYLKLYQNRSYVLALQNAPAVDGMYIDEDEKGLSFRGYQDLLLLGGGSHRTGKKGGGWQELEAFAQRHYPDCKITARWATQDCMSLDGVPYAGQYSAHTPGLYVTAGFNKWGMTGSMTAAMLLTDALLGRKKPYAAVFNPSRSILRPQLALNGVEAVFNLLTPTAPRCPHMGCALRYNPQEHSWDCPCHGSRFAGDGALLDNPATHGKRM